LIVVHELGVKVLHQVTHAYVGAVCFAIFLGYQFQEIALLLLLCEQQWLNEQILGLSHGYRALLEQLIDGEFSSLAHFQSRRIPLVLVMIS
jgi:hypothetical protein